MPKKVSKKKYLEIVDATDFYGKVGKTEDEEFLKKVFQAVISNYGNLAGAARDLQIDTISLYMSMRNHQDFNDFVREAQSYGKELKQDFVELKLLEKIKEGSERCIIFASKCINKDRGYVEKQEVAIDGEIEVKWDED